VLGVGVDVAAWDVPGSGDQISHAGMLALLRLV
jgi:hypothetical protein